MLECVRGGIPGYPLWSFNNEIKEKFPLNAHAKYLGQAFFRKLRNLNFQKYDTFFWKKIIHLVAKCYIFWNDDIEKQN